MSAFVFGPHIITNTTIPGQPFSAKFRGWAKKNGVERDHLGRIFRDNSGRLRYDGEYQGIWVISSIHDPVGGVHIILDHLHRSYIQPTERFGTPLRTSMPESTEKRIINGVECVRYPPGQTLEEAWVSPELELVIQEHTRDESHETMWEIYGIVRMEPDESLFRIPGDYHA